jgi:protease-4
MARGLVDEIGGLREAIARARAMAGLPADARVGVAGDGGGLLRALAEDDPESNARSRGLGAAIAHVAQENAPFIASLAPLALGDRSEQTLCAVPFALTIR